LMLYRRQLPGYRFALLFLVPISFYRLNDL